MSVVSCLHRASSARTLPRRSSSARALPRRELRSSAAWLACRSRVCSTPPACPRSARVSRCEFLRCQSLAARLRPNPAHPTPAPARLRRALLYAVAAHTALPARAPTHARATRASPAARAPLVSSRASSLRPRSPAQLTPLARAAPALPRWRPQLRAPTPPVRARPPARCCAPPSPAAAWIPERHHLKPPAARAPALARS
jgi:hypothetical protein